MRHSSVHAASFRPTSLTALTALSAALLLFVACSGEEGEGDPSGDGDGASLGDGDGDGGSTGGGTRTGGSTNGGDGDATGGSDPTGGDGDAPSVTCDGTPLIASGVDGVYFEVEAIDPVGDWTEETVVDGHFGDSYFQWIDEKVNAPDENDAVLRYCFAVETAGSYRMEFRGRRDREEGTFCETSASDGCNDVWIQVDGKGAFHGGEQQIWTKKMIKPPWGEWGWNDRWDPENGAPFAVEIELEAGAHVLGVSGRSHRVKLDAVRIWLDGTDKPAEP